jgi:tetraacyldisaccharide 4'-kinase
VYGAAVAVRNFLYDTGLLKSHKLAAPVISVGNITTGGTGKTPLVIWLCRYLTQKGLRCAILTRGYKTFGQADADEPALLAKSCPGVQVVVNPDRLEGAQKAITQFGAQILILDDGFQHRRIRRDLNILAVDATCPFGYGRLLPAGLLREQIRGLVRADAVVINRFDQAQPEQIDKIEKTIRKYAGQIPIARSCHRQDHGLACGGKKLPIECFRDKKLFVFCGIGNPAAFVYCLGQQGMNIVGSKFFNDHHAYSRQDIKEIAALASACGAEFAVCTQKDWVKAALLCSGTETLPFVCMVMELDFTANADKITALADKLTESAG